MARDLQMNIKPNEKTNISSLFFFQCVQNQIIKQIFDHRMTIDSLTPVSAQNNEIKFYFTTQKKFKAI